MKGLLTGLLLCILGVLGSVSNVNAQAYLALFADSLNGPIFQTSVTEGLTLGFSFDVGNLGNATFSDSLTIMAKAGNNPPFVLKELGVQTIPVGSWLPVTASDTVSSARYDGGVNIVVIWPTTPSVIIGRDSSFDTVNVILLGVKDGASNFLELVAFPNPAGDEIYLHSNTGSIVKNTKLISIEGQILRDYDGFPYSLPLSDLSAGMYFLRFETKSGEQMTIRITKR